MTALDVQLTCEEPQVAPAAGLDVAVASVVGAVTVGVVVVDEDVAFGDDELQAPTPSARKRSTATRRITGQCKHFTAGFCDADGQETGRWRVDPGDDAEVLAHLLTFVAQTTDFVGVSDPWGRVLYLNPAAQKRLGVVETDDLTLADIFPPEAFGLYYDEVRPALLRTGAWSGEVPVNVAGGDAVPMYVSTVAKIGPGGETNGSVVFARDVAPSASTDVVGRTDTKGANELLDRATFEDRARFGLAATGKSGAGCALVLLNVTGSSGRGESFSEFNASHVMRALGGRIIRLARAIDVVGRIDDHQLGLFLNGVRSRTEALRIAQMVREALIDPPVATAGGEVFLAASYGVVMSELADTPAAMIDRALSTLSPDVLTLADTRTGPQPLETSVRMDEFRVAMSHGDVIPYAQAVVDLGSGLAVGYRGLARWNHRRLGQLDAASFIDMIADTSLANGVDLYVARETAAVLVLTSRAASLRLYTPVSKRLIEDVRTEQYLAEIADAYFLSMGQIHLQVARPILDRSTPPFRDALRSLRDAGAAFAVTGVERASEVDDAADIGFREVHISRELTRAAAHGSGALRVVAEIVDAAHGRGLLVAVRGVNDREHEAALIECACDLASGSLYRDAEPAKSIEDPATLRDS